VAISAFTPAAHRGKNDTGRSCLTLRRVRNSDDDAARQIPGLRRRDGLTGDLGHGVDHRGVIGKGEMRGRAVRARRNPGFPVERELAAAGMVCRPCEVGAADRRRAERHRRHPGVVDRIGRADDSADGVALEGVQPCVDGGVPMFCHVLSPLRVDGADDGDFDGPGMIVDNDFRVSGAVVSFPRSYR